MEERVTDLLVSMTREEKIGQMTLVEKNSIVKEDIADLAIGTLLNSGGGYPKDSSPEVCLEMLTSFQEHALQRRLGIPFLFGVEVVHRHNNIIGAIIFLDNIGLGTVLNHALEDPSVTPRPSPS